MYLCNNAVTALSFRKGLLRGYFSKYITRIPSQFDYSHTHTLSRYANLLKGQEYMLEKIMYSCSVKEILKSHRWHCILK